MLSRDQEARLRKRHFRRGRRPIARATQRLGLHIMYMRAAVPTVLSLPLDCVFVYLAHNYRQYRKKVKNSLISIALKQSRSLYVDCKNDINSLAFGELFFL